MTRGFLSSTVKVKFWIFKHLNRHSNIQISIQNIRIKPLPAGAPWSHRPARTAGSYTQHRTQREAIFQLGLIKRGSWSLLLLWLKPQALNMYMWNALYIFMYNIHTQIHISIYYIDIHIYTNNVLPDGFRHDSGGEIRGRDACMTQRRGEEEGFAHLITVS